MLHKFLFLGLFFFIVFSLACGALDGKPNVSVSAGVNDPAELNRICSERSQKIDEWERHEKRKVEENFASGESGLLGGMVKYEHIEEDASEWRSQLRENCDAKREELYPDDPPWGTSTPESEVGWCMESWGEKRLDAVKDANGDLYPVIRLHDQREWNVPGKPIAMSSCGVSIYAKLDGEEDIPWAGYLYHPDTNQRIWVSIVSKDGKYRWLEGWMSP